MIWFFDNPFSLIPFSNESPTIIIFLFLNWLFVPFHEFLIILLSGADPEILALYVGHHGWPTKKILGFRWSKKAKITLETKSFGEIFLSVFSNFYNESLPMKSYQFFKIYQAFIRKEKKQSYNSQWEKKKLRKVEIFFYLTGYYLTGYEALENDN